MIKDALQYLLGLATVNLRTIGVLDYTDRPLHLLVPPTGAEVQVTTLTGLLDLIKNTIESFKTPGSFIHVVNPGCVKLKDLASDVHGRRRILVSADLPERVAFPFGQFIEHEAFVINLHAHFVPNDELSYLLRIASNLTNEIITTSQDDGISQQVALRQGASLKTSEVLRSRLTLAPYRTFTEAEQPASEFLFRVRQSKEGAVPTCALFEADGGRWKAQAMQNVRTYLAANTIIPIVA